MRSTYVLYITKLADTFFINIFFYVILTKIYHRLLLFWLTYINTLDVFIRNNTHYLYRPRDLRFQYTCITVLSRVIISKGYNFMCVRKSSTTEYGTQLSYDIETQRYIFIYICLYDLLFDIDITYIYL